MARRVPVKARLVDGELLPPPEFIRERLREPEFSLEEAWRMFYERLRREASSKSHGRKQR